MGGSDICPQALARFAAALCRSERRRPPGPRDGDRQRHCRRRHQHTLGPNPLLRLGFTTQAAATAAVNGRRHERQSGGPPADIDRGERNGCPRSGVAADARIAWSRSEDRTRRPDCFAGRWCSATEGDGSKVLYTTVLSPILSDASCPKVARLTAWLLTTASSSGHRGLLEPRWPPQTKRICRRRRAGILAVLRLPPGQPRSTGSEHFS